MYLMSRIRTIKKYGDTWVIKLMPLDAVDLELNIGDEVDVEDMVIIRRKKNA